MIAPLAEGADRWKPHFPGKYSILVSWRTLEKSWSPLCSCQKILIPPQTDGPGLPAKMIAPLAEGADRWKPRFPGTCNIKRQICTFYRLVLPLLKWMVTPSVTQLVYSCQMLSTAIGQSWSSDQQLAFDISHLSNFDQEQLSTHGDQLWPLTWPSMTKILFRVVSTHPTESCTPLHWHMSQTKAMYHWN